MEIENQDEEYKDLSEEENLNRELTASEEEYRLEAELELWRERKEKKQ